MNRFSGFRYGEVSKRSISSPLLDEFHANQNVFAIGIQLKRNCAKDYSLTPYRRPAERVASMLKKNLLRRGLPKNPPERPSNSRLSKVFQSELFCGCFCSNVIS
jgi:hypothetical protein